MKHIRITYRMYGSRREIAETCITLPMTEEAAEEFLSMRMPNPASPLINVNAILDELAVLQGYIRGEIISAEPDPAWAEIDGKEDA